MAWAWEEEFFDELDAEYNGSDNNDNTDIDTITGDEYDDLFEDILGDVDNNHIEDTNIELNNNKVKDANRNNSIVSSTLNNKYSDTVIEDKVLPRATDEERYQWWVDKDRRVTVESINTDSIHNIPIEDKVVEVDLDIHIDKHPLDTDKTRSIVIDGEGTTLADYFSLKRTSKGVANKVKRVEDIIKEGAESVGIDSDDLLPYTRRQKKKKKIRSEYRKKQVINSGNKFINNHIKERTYENAVLKSLGIKIDDLEKVLSPSSRLSEIEKATILSNPMFGKEKVKGSQNRHITFGDKQLLYYLDLVKFATVKNLSFALDRKYSSIQWQLNKLNKMGVVSCYTIYNTPGVWGLTRVGASIIGGEAPKAKQANASGLAERLWVNYVISCLYSNRLNILNLDDYPANNRLYEGEYVRGEEIVTEGTILSRLQTKRMELQGGFKVAETSRGEIVRKMRDAWEIEWRKWENSGRGIDSPELIEGNEWLYSIIYNGELSRSSYILPDIVIKRNRDLDGSPRNLAIEVEKKRRTQNYYIEKLLMYKMDTRIYEKVIYVTHDPVIAKRVMAAAEKINFDRFDVVPMVDEEGNYLDTNQWLL